MPLLLIPIMLIVVGVALIVIIGMSLFIGITLVQFLFWPAVIGLLIWWVLKRRRPRPEAHRDWQNYVHQGRKPAQHVHEERPRHHEPHDDWSDF